MMICTGYLISCNETLMIFYYYFTFILLMILMITLMIHWTLIH